MTRTVPAALQSHLDGATTSTATLWRITRQDGVVLRFTDHDQDITFGGNVYQAAAIMAAFLLLGGGSARAQLEVQVYCGGRDSLLTQLYLNYQEQPRFIALTDAGNVIEVVVSEDGRTWSIISTSPSGISCVIQTGEHWQAVEPQSPSEGS